MASGTTPAKVGYGFASALLTMIGILSRASLRVGVLFYGISVSLSNNLAGNVPALGHY